MNLYNMLIAKKLSGGGGGSSTLINKNITANGTYNATDDSADGYKKVVVNVPNPSTGSLSITSNNTYDVTNYASAVVNVPNPSTGTLSISANGTYDVTNYASADVSVSGITLDDLWTRNISGEFVSTVSGARITASTFAGTKITKVYAPYITDIGNLCFENCKQLVTAFVPLSNGSTTGFQGCSALETVVIGPDLWINVFNGCSSLVVCDVMARSGGFPRTGAFNNCSQLQTVVLRYSGAVANLANTNNFDGTPFASGGTGGTLYVPSDLISSYQSATNWSTILGYENNQIKSIESTHTDPDAPFDMTLYYADGTPIGA